MLFMETTKGRLLEQLMQGVPNFAPRRSGVIIAPDFYCTAKMHHCRSCPHYSGRKIKPCRLERYDCTNMCISDGAISHREIFVETLGAIKSVAFIRRLDEYMLESEGEIMIYRNNSHQTIFEDAIDKTDRNNFANPVSVEDIGEAYDEDVGLRL